MEKYLIVAAGVYIGLCAVFELMISDNTFVVRHISRSLSAILDVILCENGYGVLGFCICLKLDCYHGNWLIRSD